MYFNHKLVAATISIIFLLTGCVTNCEEHYDSGELKIKYQVKARKKNGKFYQYYKNGQISYKTFYINNIEEGNYKSFYENGLLKNEGKISNDVLIGEQRSYSRTGLLESVAFYEKDVLRFAQVYDTLGNVIEIVRDITVNIDSSNLKSDGTIQLFSEIHGPLDNSAEIVANLYVYLHKPEKVQQYVLDVDSSGYGEILLEIDNSRAYKIDVWYYVKNDTNKVHRKTIKVSP